METRRLGRTGYSISFITSAVSSGDMKLLPKIIDAADKYSPISRKKEDDILRESDQYEPLRGPVMP